MNIETNETLRYLHILPEQATDEILHQIQECTDHILSVMRPKCTACEYDCHVSGTELVIGDMHISSRSLSKHLADCDRAILMAATLGNEVDLYLKQLSLTDVGKAVIAQSCSVTVIEAYCDEFQDALGQDAAKRGYKMKWRFSPGYGDFALEHQKDFFRLLDCRKKIGITLTENLMMVPIKSVTAVIGLYKEASI
ncbi:MAG: vitamin B12 dependent-methionine synthase activation domain-containing protein [Lachnospiraceae bacterium]